MINWLVAIGYSLSILLIFLFSIGQLHLAFSYRKSKGNCAGPLLLKIWPRVTIQLPIYNEKYVVERLIVQVCRIDYPAELLEIQILDDSDDETREIVDRVAGECGEKGIHIEIVRRQGRHGYKAGALEHGLAQASGEFIAIFDADFLPEPDFLKSTLPHFTSDNIGMVQTRWGHLNRQYSWLTRLQAFGLDAHFSVEQTGRSHSGSFINFNGTGGVWRRACIEAAGGWSCDTLTEDLDLSYRAQLQGWKFAYLESVLSPAELPILMPAVKSQQYRWNKGAAETARKNLWAVLKSGLPVTNKLHAVQHLLSSSLFLFLFIASVLSLPLLVVIEAFSGIEALFRAAGIFVLGFLFVSYFYWIASTATFARPVGYYLSHFPLFITFSMGLSLHNAIAVTEGWLGIKTPFLRTPKFNALRSRVDWQHNQYVRWKLTPAVILEGVLALYFAFGIGLGFWLHNYGFVLFHLMLAVGFGAVFLLSLAPYGFRAFKG